jgi:hypothetical protein
MSASQQEAARFVGGERYGISYQVTMILTLAVPIAGALSGQASALAFSPGHVSL